MQCICAGDGQMFAVAHWRFFPEKTNNSTNNSDDDNDDESSSSSNQTNKSIDNNNSKHDVGLLEEIQLLSQCLAFLFHSVFFFFLNVVLSFASYYAIFFFRLSNGTFPIGHWIIMQHYS